MNFFRLLSISLLLAVGFDLSAQTVTFGPAASGGAGPGSYLMTEFRRTGEQQITVRSYGVWVGGSISFGMQYRVLGASSHSWPTQPLGPFEVETVWALTSSAIGQPNVVTAHGSNQTLGAYSPPVPDKQYDVTHANNSSVPLKVGLYNGSTLVAEVTIPPGETARLTATVPPGVELTEKFFVQSEFSDGVWLAIDDFDDTPSGTRTVNTNDLDDDTGTPPPTPPPPTAPPPTVAAPTGPSNSPSTSGTGVWTTTAATTSTEALDKTTFRQGVDKITAAVAGIGKDTAVNVTVGGGGGTGDASSLGDEVAAQEFDQEAEVDSPLSKDQVTGILSKLPVMPEITLPESTSAVTIGFDFSSLGLTGSQAMEVDFSDYEAGIEVFKAIIRACLAILFVIAATRIIRSAFAG